VYQSTALLLGVGLCVALAVGFTRLVGPPVALTVVGVVADGVVLEGFLLAV
jgi:hypothetical protein